MSPVRRITLLTNPDVCNLRCPLCFLKQRGMTYGKISGIQGEMDFDIAKGAVEKYGSLVDDAGIRILQEVIPSTMGEPLLYSHFEKLFDVCGSLGIPLNLTTNGTFPGEWGKETGLHRLLLSCSDIKVSSLALDEFGGWKENVERLLLARRNLKSVRCASVSIQATLHRRNLMLIPEMIAWASAVGIDRIKWNTVVFLHCAKQELRTMYALDRTREELRSYIMSCSKMCGSSLRHEGSVFMKDLPSGGFSLSAGTCPFKDELWIMPDGTEQRCPNPELRFGDGSETECCFI